MADEAASTASDAPAEGGTLLTGNTTPAPEGDAPTEQPNDTTADDQPKTDDAPKGDGGEEGDTGSDEGSEGAPEEYEDFDAPEGVELDPEALGKFKEIAKANNLSQDQAQQYVGIAAELIQKQQDALVGEVLAIREKWVADAKADAEFGGEQLDANLAVAQRGLDAYATPELRKLFDETGLGNHPEIIRTFVKIGKTVAEDKIVSGGTTATPQADLASRLYPSMK